MSKIMAVYFTEGELREWCRDNGVDRRDVINAQRMEHVLGHRGPGRLIVGCTGEWSEVGAEARLRGFVEDSTT